MDQAQFTRALPVLPAADIAAATAFYRDKLGFDVAFEMGDYAGVVRGGVELHLDGSEDHPPGGVSARI